MPYTTDQLTDIFSHHPPDAEQQAAYVALRSEARRFAHAIVRLTPVSADQTAAIRKVREALMTANAAIALKGKF